LRSVKKSGPFSGFHYWGNEVPKLRARNHTTLESHDTTSNPVIGSAKAEGRVMLTGEQDGKIEFIERDSFNRGTRIFKAR
jgi:hypothetical protein